MNSLFPLILFSSLVVTTYSAVYKERHPAATGYENLCYDKEDNVFYKKGEEMKWRLKGCGRQICRGSNGRDTVYTEIHTCGRREVPPKCHVEVNLDLPYPNCCERLICPEFTELEGNAT